MKKSPTPKDTERYTEREKAAIFLVEDNERRNNSLTNRVGRKLGIKAAHQAFHQRAHQNTMLTFELPIDYLADKLDREQ